MSCVKRSAMWHSSIIPMLVGWTPTQGRRAVPPSAMVLREKATIDKPGGLLLVIHQGARNRSEMPCRAKGSERLTGPMAARAPATVLRVCVCDDIPGMGSGLARRSCGNWMTWCRRFLFLPILGSRSRPAAWARMLSCYSDASLAYCLQQTGRDRAGDGCLHL